MEIILTHRVSGRLVRAAENGWFFPFRYLCSKDITMIKKYGLKRVILPSLSESQSKEFFISFDNFWNSVIEDRGRKNSFWRTAVSSKMQPWEMSIGYFCLVIFTLSRMDITDKLLILVDNFETKKTILKFARIKRWKISPLSYLEKAIFFRFKDNLWRLGLFFFRLGQCFCKKILTFGIRYDLGKQDGCTRVLIVSSLYPQSTNNNKYRDPFFNDLHVYIKQKGYRVTYLCEILNKCSRDSLKKISQCGEVGVLPLYSQVRYRDIARIFLKLLLRNIRFSKCYFEECELSEFISWEIRSFRFSFDINAEIFYSAIKNLSSKYKFERIITNFEGNAFERACAQAAEDSEIQTVIGYAHPVLYAQNLKIRLTAKESSLKPGPNRYICTGSYSKDLFMRIGVGHSDKSVKDGCMIKNMPFCILERDNAGEYILVALDGVNNTSVVLDWIFIVALSLKQERFIVRSHPNISLKFILKQCINDVPNNVNISTGNLNDDIKKSVCVFYRHSSVGIQAILNGVPAVYLDIDSPLSGDPIKELNYFKWSVGSKSDFFTILQIIKNLSSVEAREQLGKARFFLGKYFAEPTAAELDLFTNRINEKSQ